jgi:hypothetical protein
MKKKTKLLFGTAFALLAVLGASVYASGGSLQGRFTTSGSVLTIDTASTTPRADILVAGSSYNHVSDYRFTTVGEAVEVTKLQVTLQGSTTAYSTIYLEYEDSSGGTITDRGTVVGGSVQFSGIDLDIPADESKTLQIYADVNAIGSGATSGDSVKAVIAKTNFQAVGQSTGTTYSTLTFSATAAPNTMRVYASKPTISLDSTSPSGPRTVSASDTAFIFDVTADAAADLDLDSLRVTLTSDADFETTATVAGTLSDADTGVALMPSVNIAFRNSSQASFYWTDDVTVFAGTTRRFELTLDTATLLEVEDEGTETNPLTFSINLGTPLTAGGLVWNDGYADVSWMGYVTNTTLSSSTLTY